VQDLIDLRKSHPNLHRRKFFQDRRIDPEAPERQVNGGVETDVLWLRTDGNEMTQEEWQTGWVRCIGLLLNGRTLDDVNAVGELIVDDSFLLLLNPHHEAVRFTLPPPRPGTGWDLCIDTSRPERREKTHRNRFRKYHQLMERSLALFKETKIFETR